MTPDDYLRTAAGLLEADGSRVSRVQLPGGAALVGYRSKFKLAWAATKLHLFTVLYPTDLASPMQLDALSQDALDYAKATKGALRGLQSGVAIIPVLVARSVSDQARAAALARPEKKFAAFVLPAVVDLTTGQTFSYSGRFVWGGVYAKWMRARVAATVPPPAALPR